MSHNLGKINQSINQVVKTTARSTGED